MNFAAKTFEFNYSCKFKSSLLILKIFKKIIIFINNDFVFSWLILRDIKKQDFHMITFTS